ncbi:MAG: hypothetical protein ACYC69_02115 [Thermodesulfovibrionales bacterium]
MYTRDHETTIHFLLDQYCLPRANAVFVDDVAACCRASERPVPDASPPLKLIVQEPAGCRMFIRNHIPEDMLRQRIHALSVRNQTTNVALDNADRLNSDRKKLAYLFLSEYASSLAEITDDDRFADTWVFNEMERLGFFRS